MGKEDDLKKGKEVVAREFLDDLYDLAYMKCECTLDLYPEKHERFKKMDERLMELLTLFGTE